MRKVLLLNDTSGEQHHGCARVMQAIDLLLTRNALELVARWPAHRPWHGDLEFEQAFERADLILVNGEGTIHHDRAAGRWLLEIGREANAAGKPAALINCGWEANSPALLGMLGTFSLLAARDHGSAQEMAGAGKEVRVVPDLSLYPPVPGGCGPRDGLGVTDNVDRFKALELDRLRRTYKARAIAIAWPRPGLASRLQFLRQGISLANDWRSPGTLCRLARMRWDLSREGQPDTDRFLKMLGSLELLVSGRFHACTLALAMATPFLAQPSNTNKIQALVRDAGLAPWRADISLPGSGLGEAILQGWSRTERSARSAYLADARVRTEQLFADIRQLAG